MPRTPTSGVTKSTKPKGGKKVKSVKPPCPCQGTTSESSHATLTGDGIGTDAPLRIPCGGGPVTLLFPSPCCPCNEVETGVTAFMWRDAAGNCRCLPFPGTDDKYLKWNTNGPYFSNT